MLQKKIIKIGSSKAMIIPSSYIRYWEMMGKQLKGFDIKVADNLVLRPIFEEIDEVSA